MHQQLNMLVTHLSLPELEAGLDEIRRSPKDAGELKLIVRRPRVNVREVLEDAQLDLIDGLAGDTWKYRASSRSSDKTSPHPDMQINVMNARAVALVAQDPARWALAGDQLYVDLDLSRENLPAASRIGIGTAVIEVTSQPHTGCGKFVERFGPDAMKFVHSPVGRALNLRGINARVVQAGAIRRGDIARKL